MLLLNPTPLARRCRLAWTLGTAAVALALVAGLSAVRLTAAQVKTLRDWIDQGATWPEPGGVDERRTHWAFQPVKRPAVPPMSGRNAVDAFLAGAAVFCPANGFRQLYNRFREERGPLGMAFVELTLTY